jgi:hypothetical protein
MFASTLPEVDEVTGQDNPLLPTAGIRDGGDFAVLLLRDARCHVRSWTGSAWGTLQLFVTSTFTIDESIVVGGVARTVYSMDNPWGCLVQAMVEPREWSPAQRGVAPNRRSVGYMPLGNHQILRPETMGGTPFIAREEATPLEPVDHHATNARVAIVPRQLLPQALGSALPFMGVAEPDVPMMGRMVYDLAEEGWRRYGRPRVV